MSRRLAACLLIAAAAAIPGEPASERDHFRLALREEARGHPHRAAAQYRAVLDLAPDHRAARRALGYRRHGKEWIHAVDDRTRANRAVALARSREKEVREQGHYAVLALPRNERRRALAILLRNPRRDVRLRAIEALAEHGDSTSVGPLVRHLVVLRQGGSPQRSYISRTNQIAFVQDFDVEVA